MSLKYIYDGDSNETVIELDGEQQTALSGKVTAWRGGIPTPDSDQYNEFEDWLLKLDSPTERRVLLYLHSGNIEKTGFNHS